ncbi:MAG: hypothetical protein AB7V46_15820 [Thermomicrobiales bacterium]
MASPANKPVGTEPALDKLRSMIDQVFTEDQIEELRKRLQESEERFERLRDQPLENGDEPAPGFHPFRREGGSM